MTSPVKSKRLEKKAYTATFSVSFRLIIRRRQAELHYYGKPVRRDTLTFEKMYDSLLLVNLKYVVIGVPMYEQVRLETRNLVNRCVHGYFVLTK